MFYNNDGEEIDPLSLLGKYCYTTAAVKIESIFIGNKISMQVKLYECEVRLMETGMKRMMKKRPEGQKRVLVANTTKPMDENEVASDSDASVNDSGDDNDLIEKTKNINTNDSGDDTEQTNKTSVKTKIRRVKKVVRKAVVTKE